MKINRLEFIDILQKIRPGLGKKDIVEQTTHFIFTGKNLLTYNDQISISYPFRSKIKCSVPADEFYKILNEIDCDDLEISLEESILYFETKKVKVQLSVNLEIDKALLIEVNEDWKRLPSNFAESISFCSFSASKDMTHPVLTCLYINGQHVVSSDNYRISQYYMKGKMKDTFLFPASVVKELIKFPIQSYSISESWLFFKTEDDVVFSCRRMEGDFPDISKLFEIKGKEIILPKETKKAVNVSSILAEGEFESDRKIKVKIKDGKLTCSGEREIGKIDFCIEAKSLKGKEFSFGINPEFFNMILAKSNSVIIEDNKLLFIAENFKHIISLF